MGAARPQPRRPAARRSGRAEPSRPHAILSRLTVQSVPGVTVMTTTTTSDLDVLRDLNQAYLDAVRLGDVERFRQLLADDFQCSTPAGELLDKAAFLART